MLIPYLLYFDGPQQVAVMSILPYNSEPLPVVFPVITTGGGYLSLAL